MVMQVKHALSGVGAGVDDDAITAVSDALLARQSPRDSKDLPDQLAVGFGDLGHANDMLARYDQDMHRCSRRNVFKRDDGIVSVNHIGRDLTVDNTAEETFTHESVL